MYIDEQTHLLDYAVRKHIELFDTVVVILPCPEKLAGELIRNELITVERLQLLLQCNPKLKIKKLLEQVFADWRNNFNDPKPSEWQKIFYLLDNILLTAEEKNAMARLLMGVTYNDVSVLNTLHKHFPTAFVDLDVTKTLFDDKIETDPVYEWFYHYKYSKPFDVVAITVQILKESSHTKFAQCTMEITLLTR